MHMTNNDPIKDWNDIDKNCEDLVYVLTHRTESSEDKKSEIFSRPKRKRYREFNLEVHMTNLKF